MPDAVIGKREHPAFFAFIHTLEILTGADRPVDRIGGDAEDLFDLLHQLIRISGLPVHLIDEGEDRDIPHHANLEQLDRLFFHALGPVDHHDRRVGRHQGTVSVLREILVPGGVENIDAVSVVVELHNGRSHGNTALLFNFHPIGNRVLHGFFAFDHTGGLNRASVQKQLFCQGGFARIGVGDNGECTPLFNFINKTLQTDDPPSSG